MTKSQYAGNWKRIRLAVLERDNYTCHCTTPRHQHPGGVCGLTLHHDTSQAHVDHIVSVATARQWGWTEDEIRSPENLRTLCAWCNRSRGDGTSEFFSKHDQLPPPQSSSLPPRDTPGGSGGWTLDPSMFGGSR